ncbi:hypothetical protein FVEG_03830 [Fusarium verticillioides 7600]|uniref:Glutathione S-transferase n=1 Tax=Gibberella moniliformis (strain M3125 / FGSC 7600) TaxID=334819 RepID=W7M2M7_GIBM7|nr:hypothetical protein FVEG_03830 [Fusarium verticillioides 7600]EWG41820.1 hypothetical protein FVEG_03830 [Fusarium verticillioides 7600]
MIFPSQSHHIGNHTAKMASLSCSMTMRSTIKLPYVSLAFRSTLLCKSQLSQNYNYTVRPASIVPKRSYSMARPTGLIASKGIELLSWGTPNGVKAHILLEELRDAYGLDYTIQGIDIGLNVQKEPWFTAINPNGRIPVLVDHDNNDLAVFEGNAILSYLTRKYDPEHKLSFKIDDDDYTRAESWIGWQHGGIGPMEGQAFHFLGIKPEIPYAIQRYVGETERLFGVLDKRLADRDYIVGPGRGRYSIADIALVGWADRLPGTSISYDQFPNVKAWLARILERPAVKRGLLLPSGKDKPTGLDPVDEETRRKRAELKEVIDQAKEQFGYKYSSP